VSPTCSTWRGRNEVSVRGATPDETDGEALAAVRERLVREFGLAPRTIELPPVEFALDPVRKQYGSIPVMEMLARNCPADAFKVLAVTGRDLFIPV